MEIKGFRIATPYEFSTYGRGLLPQCLSSYSLDDEITGVGTKVEEIGNLEKFERN